MCLTALAMEDFKLYIGSVACLGCEFSRWHLEGNVSVMFTMS